MDPTNNPFAPGAGSPPPELAGRDDILEATRISYVKAKRGLPSRSFMLLGLRGVGKTVLLNEIGRRAQADGMAVSMVESPEYESLAELLYPLMGKVLRSLSATAKAKDLVERGLAGLRNFARSLKIKIDDVEISINSEPGIADSGNIEYDLPDMFELIGEAAKKADKAWVLLIDEVQYLSSKDLSALIVGLHKMAQKQLPAVFIGAGLPQTARLAAEAKSYAERLFVWNRIGPLNEVAVKEAVVKPLISRNTRINDDAVKEIYQKTEGYPFFIQAWAYSVWEQSEGPGITLEDVRQAQQVTLQSLDDGFFHVRLDRLTDMELTYARAMSDLGRGPYKAGEIAKQMGREVRALSQVRGSLIKKGLIYSPCHGTLDFTVPLFADYLQRTLQVV